MYSVMFGAALCLYYDVARIFRLAVRHSAAAVFCEDLSFWITSAFAVFLFLLARTNGELRGYVFVSLLAGFFACRFTVSRLFVRIGTLIADLLARPLRFFARIYRAFTEKTMHFCCRISANIKKMLKKLFCKVKNS